MNYRLILFSVYRKVLIIIIKGKESIRYLGIKISYNGEGSFIKLCFLEDSYRFFSYKED